MCSLIRSVGFGRLYYYRLKTPTVAGNAFDCSYYSALEARASIGLHIIFSNYFKPVPDLIIDVIAVLVLWPTRLRYELWTEFLKGLSPV